MMRAKALECISLVGMSIGKDRFREDAHQVLQYMQTLQVRFIHIWVVTTVQAHVMHKHIMTLSVAFPGKVYT